MNDDELKESWEELLNIYKGILFNNPDFSSGKNDKIIYDFKCPEFRILKEKYNLESVAGEGGELEKAIRLLGFFAPRISHKSDFSNDIGCNAMDLLEYCLDKPEKGVNCLNKSKILQECCLALGIHARRIWLMPYSPYDTDNHVVIEIYDSNLKKWVMLDMTSNGYFVDGNGLPLSVLELRNSFTLNTFCEFTKTTVEPEKFFTDMQMERLYYKQYFAKNLFFLYAEVYNGFGNRNKHFVFTPQNFDLAKNMKLSDRGVVLHISDIATLIEAPFI